MIQNKPFTNAIAERLNVRQLGIVKLSFIVCALLLALAVGISSSLTIYGFAGVVFALGCIVTISAGIGLFLRPDIAICAAIYFIFFPVGILPEAIHSIVFDSILLIAFCGWFFTIVRQRRSIVWCAATIAMFCFVVWCIVSVMWATYLIEARQQTVQYAIDFSLLFLANNLIDSRKRLDMLMRTLAFGGWTLIAAGLWTILSGGYSSGIRLKIFEMNENLAPTLLLIASVGVVWCAIHGSQRWTSPRMIGSYLFICLMLVIEGLSGSRGGLISCCVLLVTLWFSKQTRPWGWLGVALAIAGIAVVPLFFTTILNRFEDNEGGELGGRVALWQAGWSLLQDHPLGGAGIGNGKRAMPPYVYDLVTYEEEGVWEARSSHNPFLDVGIDTGLIGMSIYISIMVFAFKSFANMYARARRLEEHLPRVYYAIVFCVALAYFISWIRDGGMNYHPSLFIILALCILPARIKSASLLSAAL